MGEDVGVEVSVGIGVGVGVGVGMGVGVGGIAAVRLSATFPPAYQVPGCFAS